MTARKICTRFASTTTREVGDARARTRTACRPGFFETHLTHVRDVFSREIGSHSGVHTVISERLEVPCASPPRHSCRR